MSIYQHVLAAIEADEDGHRVLLRAHELAGGYGAKLTVLHVVDFLPVEMADGMLTPPIDYTDERATASRERLLPWCTELGLTEDRLHIVTGDIAREIVRAASELHADLIVVGHHRHRGLSSLFTHTEEGVLSRAECDVLAVALSPLQTS